MSQTAPALSRLRGIAALLGIAGLLWLPACSAGTIQVLGESSVEQESSTESPDGVPTTETPDSEATSESSSGDAEVSGTSETQETQTSDVTGGSTSSEAPAESSDETPPSSDTSVSDPPSTSTEPLPVISYGAAPVPASVPGSFLASNDDLATAGSWSSVCQPVDGDTPCQYWNNVRFWSFVPPADMTLTIRAVSIRGPDDWYGWDNTLEVWRVDGDGLVLVAQRDDAYGLDAMVTTPMTAGTTYLIGLGGYGSYSKGTATIYLGNLPPEKPAPPQATPGDGQIALSWTAPADNAAAITHYTIRAFSGGEPVGTPVIVSGAPPAASGTVAGLANGTAYTFTVSASNANGESAQSDPVAATPVAPGEETSTSTEPTPVTTSSSTRPTSSRTTAPATPAPSTTLAATTPVTTPTTVATTTSRPPVRTSPPAVTTSASPPAVTTSPAASTARTSAETAAPTTSSAAETEPPVTTAEDAATTQSEPVAQTSAPAPSSTQSAPAGPDTVTTAPSSSTQPTPPVGPGQTFTWEEPPPAAPLPADLESTSLEVSSHTPAPGGEVTLTATGFAPGTVVDFFIHSTPLYLGSAVADASGVAALPVTLRPELSALHHVQAMGTGADGEPRNVAQSITITAPKGLAALPKYNPADHPQEVLSTQVAALTLVAALGGFGVAAFSAAGAAAAPGTGAPGGVPAPSGPTAASGEGSRKRKMSLASAKVKHVKFRHEAERWGDRSSTWMWPWVERLDAISLAWPAVVLKYSPLTARTVNDGAYLRAAAGPLWFLMPIAGVVLGTVAGADADWQPLPPSLGIVTAIVLLGIADVTAGFLAAAVYTVGVAVAGNIASWDALRSVLGVDVVFFTVALAAFAARVLRRAPGRTWRDIFDRGADIVIATLFGMWAMQKVVKALPAITGVEIPLAEHGDRLAIIAGAGIVVRYLLETVVAAQYPRRLAVVAPPKMGFPGPAQQIVSAVFKTFLFVLFAIAYIGNRWELWVGAALFLVPSVCYAYLMKFPNIPGLVRWLPGGIVKTVLMSCVGTWAAALLAIIVTDPERMMALGFVLLSLPGLMLALLGLFGRDGEKWPETWWTRLLGIPVLVLGVLIVQKIISVI